MKKILTFFTLFTLFLLFVQCEKDRTLHTPISERTLFGETLVFELQPTVVWPTAFEQQETDYFNLTQTFPPACLLVVEPLEMETSIEEVFYDNSTNSVDITIHGNIVIEGGSIFENYHFRINDLSEGTHNISEDVMGNYCFVAMSIIPPAPMQELEIDEFFETGHITITEITAEYLSLIHI
mgnify:FL=1